MIDRHVVSERAQLDACKALRRDVIVHRQAAVATSRLIRCDPKASRSETVFG
ncbi:MULTISPECIES: hypothetical protein [unclassified Sphingopyxis]|uniref:hypothetical protein n=1 Tax=unclassified Sphingopyxis TaxID=2614943 RepID=UPI00286458EB|nr:MULTISPECIES: hypothetical protein [unclassified Sphingopyxis]MDR6834825.1 hypothetical protein [Sphingopyxis sp. BE122]MDR7227096.1 hypothetical protein [Sphingopyxis sp. BE259]